MSFSDDAIACPPLGISIHASPEELGLTHYGASPVSNGKNSVSKFGRVSDATFSSGSESSRQLSQKISTDSTAVPGQSRQ